MSACYVKIINSYKGFFLRSQGKWVIFGEVLYYFHESTSLAIFTKNDLSGQEKRRNFPYFLEVLIYEIYSKFV